MTFTTLIIHYILVNPKVVNVTTLCSDVRVRSDVHYFVFTVLNNYIKIVVHHYMTVSLQCSEIRSSDRLGLVLVLGLG